MFDFRSKSKLLKRTKSNLGAFNSPTKLRRRQLFDLNPFSYLPLKSMSSDFQNLREDLIEINEKKIIRMTQENKLLRVDLVKVKRQKKQVDLQNKSLKQKLSQYSEQIQQLKKQLNTDYNGYDKALQTVNSTSSLISSQCLKLDYVDMNQFTKIKMQNQILEQSLSATHRNINKLNNQIQRSNISLNFLYNKLNQKQKCISRLKYKNFTKKLFQLSDDSDN